MLNIALEMKGGGVGKGTIKKKIWEDDQMKFNLSTQKPFYETLGLLRS